MDTHNAPPALDPTPGAPSGVSIFATSACPYCATAEKYLRSRGADAISKTMIDERPDQRELMASLSGGRRSVPQIFIAGVHIGGCDDLMAFGSKYPAALRGLLAQAGCAG